MFCLDYVGRKTDSSCVRFCSRLHLLSRAHKRDGQQSRILWDNVRPCLLFCLDTLVCTSTHPWLFAGGSSPLPNRSISHGCFRVALSIAELALGI